MIHRRRIGLVAASLLLVTGCTFAPSGDLWVPEEGASLPILREMSGTFSSIDRRMNLVVHDLGTLSEIPLDPGPVDFSREMVLLAALGPTPSERFAIRIKRISRDGAVLRPELEVRFPSARAPRRASRASPYHLIVVPKTNMNVIGFTPRYPGPSPAPGTRD